MIQIIEQLLIKDVAYEKAGNVYFDVDSWESFGELSRLTREEMLPIANERGNNPDDPHKRDPLDFVLWQAGKQGEPSWESPWGEGRPGWHIECSTMATDLLGDKIDIHSGGGDLLFPHHECEIVQVEPVTGKRPFVRFWLHIAMVYHEGEKMSKSLGNLVMVRDLIKEYSSDALRIYLAMHHYRESWSYDVGDLNRAVEIDSDLRRALASDEVPGDLLDTSSYTEAFFKAMDDDLDSPSALEVIQNMVGAITEASTSRKNISEAKKALRSLGAVLGLRMDCTEPDPLVIQGWDNHLSRFLD
jgi:L-cysteine:1D-myo-inositol 2-amino-2-deoxy-alpha-D-glucopyranoside ligase